MPVERLKVRCYRCNQLLAVAPNKAGAVVACPRCKAELLIPSPEDSPEGDGPAVSGPSPRKPPAPRASVSTSALASPATEVPTFLEEIAAAIPPEVAALRPEDLRVEAEFFEGLTREAPAPEAPESNPLAFLNSPEPLAAPAVPMEPGTTTDPPLPGLELLPEPVAAGPMIAEAPPPVPASRLPLELPPIEIEPPTILPPGVQPRRVREVVLPASVVLAWSLFVLAAVAMSFLAGLLIGHFLWKPTA